MREVIRDPENTDAPLVLQPHQWAYASDIRPGIVYGAGGWGSGKSYALLVKIGLLLSYNPPGTRGAIVLPTGPLLSKFMRAQFMPAFRRLLSDFSKSEMVATIHGDREIFFISAFEPERMELLTLAWAVGDEAGLWPHETMRQMVSRVRDPRARYRQVSFVGVPRYGWLHDEFCGVTDSSGDRRTYRLKTSDNAKAPPQYLDSLLSACPARMRKCYLEGEFVAPGGNVFPEYDEGKHIIAWDDSKPQAKTIAAIDWSPRTPHVLIIQIVQDSTIDGKSVTKLSPQHAGAAMVIADELVLDGSTPLTVEKICMEIKSRGWKVAEVICDPAGGAAEATSGIDQIRIAQAALGVRVLYSTTRAQRDIRNGVEHVRALLEPGKDSVPRLYISKSVLAKAQTLPHHLRSRSVVNALRMYSYPQISDGKPVSNTPVKDGITDHACDCVRYAAVWYFPVSRLSASASRY